jgi:hypothetical protein
MADRDGNNSYWAETMRSGAATEQARADAYCAHLGRIDAYVTAWRTGRITLAEKRRAISDENRTYYGPDCRRNLLWP